MADEQEFEDDVQDLLGQLDETDADSYVVDRMEEEYQNEPAEIEGNPSGTLTVESVPAASPPPKLTVEDLKPTDGRSPNQAIVAPTFELISDESTAAPVDSPIIDTRKELDTLNGVIDEVLQGTRADRQEVQDAINICRTEIDKSVTNNGQPMRMWVDNIAKLLEVKANVNMTAVKAMDSKAKLLAAMKGQNVNVQTNIQNNNANIGRQDQSLIDLLASNPLDPSDD